MANQYKNEVIYNGQTLISLKEDTVTPDKVLAGETFHDRSGSPQTGNLITHNVYDGLDSTSTSDALSANQGRELNNSLKTKLDNYSGTHTIEILNDTGFISLMFRNKNVAGKSIRLNFFDTGKVTISRYANGAWQTEVTLRNAD